MVKLSKLTKRQSGLTLLELVIVMAIGAMLIVPMGFAVSQIFNIPFGASASLTVTNQARRGAEEVARDARHASSFTTGSSPSYGTFTWTDSTGTVVETHSVQYLYSTTDLTLLREETLNTGSSQSFIAARGIAQETDVSIQASGDLVLVSVTSTSGAVGNTTISTADIRARRRPSPALAPQPTPPPATLAFDDFESGALAGGSGWLEAWVVQGGAQVVSNGSPYEGTNHLRLRTSPDRADRSLDLSGRANVRIQFQAKADAFNPGETVLLQVSDDFGGTFNTVRTWVDGEDDDVYRPEDINLSSFTMTNEFFIAFVSNISGGGTFYVDDLKVVIAWSG